MLSYQIYRDGAWYHCESHVDFHNHRGVRSVVFLTRAMFAELVASRELRVLL